jgi:hypothetical protein
MSERREVGIYPSEKQSFSPGTRREAPSSEQETPAEPTGWEAQPESTNRRCPSGPAARRERKG